MIKPSFFLIILSFFFYFKLQKNFKKKFDETHITIRLVLQQFHFFTDCVDTHEDCEHWEKKGYCDATDSQYLETRELCPKSCGVCTACSKEKGDGRFNLLSPV